MQSSQPGLCLDRALATANGPLAFSDGSGPAQLISPFMPGFETHTHVEIGDTQQALNLIRTVWGKVTPGFVFYSGGVQESLSLDGVTSQFPLRSLARGWSSGPTSALSAYVLGVRPTAPGFASWIVVPQAGDLPWAEGTVPTPKGPIAVLGAESAAPSICLWIQGLAALESSPFR